MLCFRSYDWWSSTADFPQPRLPFPHSPRSLILADAARNALRWLSLPVARLPRSPSEASIPCRWEAASAIDSDTSNGRARELIGEGEGGVLLTCGDYGESEGTERIRLAVLATWTIPTLLSDCPMDQLQRAVGLLAPNFAEAYNRLGKSGRGLG